MFFIFLHLWPVCTSLQTPYSLFLCQCFFSSFSYLYIFLSTLFLPSRSLRSPPEFLSGTALPPQATLLFASTGSKDGFFPRSKSVSWVERRNKRCGRSLTWNRQWSFWGFGFCKEERICEACLRSTPRIRTGFCFLEQESEVLVLTWRWMVLLRRRGWSLLWWPELRLEIVEGGGVSVNLSHGMADLARYGNANRDIQQVSSLSVWRLWVWCGSSNCCVNFNSLSCFLFSYVFVG